MPSETFLRTFFRTRWAALLAGDLAIGFFQSLLLQCRGALARTLAGAGIGAGALTAHRQAAAMTEAPVAADVHQTLDVHRRLTTQVTLDGELGDLVADLFQIGVSQFLDLLGIVDAACVADLASTGAPDTVDGRQTNFGMLMGRNINTSDTSHVRPLMIVKPSALALLVTLIRADHAHHTLAADDFAVTADLLYRSRNSHCILLNLSSRSDPRGIQRN